MVKVIPGAIANLIKISKKNFKKWFLAISSSLYESQKLPGTTFMVKVVPGNFQLTYSELGIARNNFQTVGRCWQFLMWKIANLIKISKIFFKKWFLAISCSLYEGQKLPGITIWHFLKTFGQILKITPVPGNSWLTICEPGIARNHLHFESAATSWQFLAYI